MTANTLSREVVKVKFIKFWWNSGKDDIILGFPDNLETKEIERLLDDYRNSDPEGYNIGDFIDFLDKHGIKAEVCEPEEIIYF